MASVTSQSGIQRSSGPTLLDLDAGNGLPEMVQNIVGLLVIVAFCTMAGMWIQPLVETEGQAQSHPVSSVWTVSALHSTAPEYGVIPHRATGPTAAVHAEQQSADSGTVATGSGGVIDPSDSHTTNMRQDPIV